MPGEGAQGNHVLGRTGDGEVREVTAYRIVVGELALAFQDRQGEGGDGLGHGGNAEDGIGIDFFSFVVSASVGLLKDRTLRSFDTDADIGQGVAGNKRLDACIHTCKIKRHGGLPLTQRACVSLDWKSLAFRTVL